eukprot:CAMPEP_0172160392 /NCGR_PEP_ID=MMETSP1050-20130122/5533_1 /TAXON_ID=233186 /ORGANISM="Cryptomonas curvata, Strain CCAP979/52" /LENGTH=118 /DNA_ID=CAMNT_0012830151 /DNA_START=99 /DNA_END=455 /DNA_ORIENTATION=+
MLPTLSSAHSKPSNCWRAEARLRRGRNLLMCEKGGDKVEEDPFVVKPSIPSFAKTENQWKIDESAGVAPDDSAKKLVAITTGAVALVISVLYLFAVVALESRGPLQPPPPEALVSFLM